MIKWQWEAVNVFIGTGVEKPFLIRGLFGDALNEALFWSCCGLSSSGEVAPSYNVAIIAVVVYSRING